MEELTMVKAGNPEMWEVNKAFFQANTVKGGRYIDDAGKIVNDYVDAYDGYTVGLDGLRFANPKSKDMPNEIVVDMNRVWLSCYEDGCIKKTKETAGTITKRVCHHMGVDSYNRLGFRVFYYKVVRDVRSYTKSVYLRVMASEMQRVVGSSEKVREMASRVKFLSPPFSISLVVQTVNVLRPPQKAGDFAGDGILIDIDVSEDKESSERVLNLKHLATFLGEASDRAVAKATEIVALLEGEKESER